MTTSAPPGVLAAFLASQAAAGYAPSTVRRRAGIVRAYLASVPDFAAAGYEDRTAWVEALDLPRATAEQHRMALAAFYRWAAQTGLLTDAPAPAGPARSSRRSGASAGPAGENLDTFAAWLRRGGMGHRTLMHRLAVVRAFVGDHPEPLSVPDAAVLAWLERRGLSRRTQQTYEGHLRAFFRWAGEAGLSPSAALAPRGGPGTASSVTAYGRGRVLLPVTDAWQRGIEAWLDWQASAGRPETTIYLREYQVRRLGVAFPGRDPFDLTGDDLTRWLAPMMWSNETRRSFRSALRSFYGWAHATGRMDNNPAAALPAPKVGRPRARPAPESVVLQALIHGGERIRLMVQLGAGLGLRRAEIATLHTDHLVQTLDGPSLRITGKGGHTRMLPLPEHLAEALRALPPGWVFPGQSEGHLSPHHVGVLLSEALGPGYTAHALRHRFATVAYAPTEDLLAVQQLLGHSSPVTTQRYVLTPDSALRSLVQQSDPLHP